MKVAMLRNGAMVLAKDTKYGVTAVTYANRTQAQKSAAKLVASGQSADVAQFCGSRVFYVVIAPNAFDAAKSDETTRDLVADVIATKRTGEVDQTAYCAIIDRINEL